LLGREGDGGEEEGRGSEVKWPKQCMHIWISE
jgi:hypothetical protein